MPPSAKRRKPNATTASRKNAVAPSLQRGIQGYGRISKAQPDKGKSKPVSKGKDDLVSTSATPEDSSTSRKRKASNPEKDATTQAVPTKRLKTHESIGKRLPGISRYASTTPRTPRKNVFLHSTPIETPTKGARQHLESLDLISSPCSERQSTPSLSHVDTPPSSPVHPDTPEEPPNQVDAPEELPEELQDLIDLHSSFLTALSLHFTHHGSLTPADFRILRPNVERSWRKRRVKIQDIQRILTVGQASAAAAPTTLSLADYGHSKICVEIATRSEQLLSPQKRLLNEEMFNATFATNLLSQWKTFSTTSKPASGSPVETFITSLPLLPITPCTSATVLAPLLAKGQRRLEDLKAGAIKAQARSNPSTTTTTFPSEPSAPSSSSSDKENSITPARTVVAKAKDTPLARKSSLFDRIKQKQAAREADSSSTTPLTPAQRLRLTALHRVEEIVPVLELLVSSSSSSSSSSSISASTGGPSTVKSFTMPTIVQYLQMSLRNPIETEVAVRAVRLLAEEVGPRGWVGVKEVGRILGVTVRGGETMVGGRGEVRRRVQEAIAGGA